MCDKNIQNRLLHVSSETLQAYSSIFGYSTINIYQDSRLTHTECEKLGLTYGSNNSSSRNGFVLNIDEADRQDKVNDRLSAFQFAIDLEALSSLPRSYVTEIDRDYWIAKIRNYIEGFENRDWIVTTDLRPSLAKEFVELVEIPRKKVKSSGQDMVVSASAVRRFLSENDYDSIERLVPTTTFQYLKEWRNQ